MPLILLTGLFAVALWSLVAHRFERWGVAGPAALAVCGAVIVVVDPVGFTDAVTTPAAERAVEIVLAVLLFVDACEVRGGIFGAVGRPLARLVFIALPLSLVFVVLAGAMLLPGSNPLALVVIACIVMPTDFAPAASLLRAPWVPERVRRILAVESGYNDGLVSPVFGMSLALAAGWPALVTALGRPTPDAASENEADHALAEFVGDFLGAVPATAFAILIGAALGALFGFVARAALARGWANPTGVRYAMLIVPLLAYGLATTSGFAANGFVAAFVAGIFYRLLRARGHEHGGVPHDELAFVEDVGTFAASGVWFTLGALATLVVVHGVDPRLLLLALLALTVLRAVPVYTAMLGSPVPWRERTLIGLLGPRGTATIVFGMLAFAKLPRDEAFAALEVMVFTVLGSILLHGIIAPAALRRVPARSAG